MTDHAADMDIAAVAHLACLALEPDEARALTAELGAILGYVAQLEAVDTEGVPPTSHPLPLDTPYRPDVATPPLDRELALAGAPRSDGEAVVVPRVV